MSLKATRAALELQARLGKVPAAASVVKPAVDLRAALSPQATKDDALRSALQAKKPGSAKTAVNELNALSTRRRADDAELDFFGDSQVIESGVEDTEVTISISISGNGKVSIKS